MAPDLPVPLVPADVDCVDLDGFMLNVERLMASELVALSSHEVVGAALFLWCRAWKQRPAASLPDDDRVLAAFARLSTARFRKLKNEILRGFVKCSDGRLYHAVLAAEALNGFERKQAFRKKRDTDAERLRKWRESQKETPSVTVGETHVETHGETRFVAEGQGQGQGQVVKKERTTLRVDASASPRSIAEEVKAALFGPCLRYLTASTPDAQARSLIGKWRRDYGDVDAAAAIAEAEKASASQPVEFIIGVLQRRNANRRPDPNGPPRLATAI